MDNPNPAPQLLLFASPATTTRPLEHPRMRRRRTNAGGRLRMIARIESLAESAERDARECRRAGDMIGARAARDRAVGARRAAQILRAGPDGVAQIFDGSHPEAA